MTLADTLEFLANDLRQLAVQLDKCGEKTLANFVRLREKRLRGLATDVRRLGIE